MRPARKQAFELGMRHFGLPEHDTEPLDPRTLFAKPPARLFLEIGFGAGEHLVARARENRDDAFLGADIYEDGVAACAAAALDCGLFNLRIFHGDANRLLARLPHGALDGAFVLFPDPWPKRKHHKRRILNPKSLDVLASLVAPGGFLRLASDDPGMQTHMLATLEACPHFRWTAPQDPNPVRRWSVRPCDQVSTRYEAKALAAGRASVFLEYIRDGEACRP